MRIATVGLMLLCATTPVRPQVELLERQWVYADVVFLGRAVDIEACAHQCDDFGVVVQSVSYEVLHVYKGAVDERIQVAHDLWGDRPDVVDCCIAVSGDVPVVVFVHKELGEFVDQGDFQSVFPATDKTLETLRTIAECDNVGRKTPWSRADHPPWIDMLSLDRLKVKETRVSPDGKRILVQTTEEFLDGGARAFVSEREGTCLPKYLSGRRAEDPSGTRAWFDAGSGGAIWLDRSRVAFLAGSPDYLVEAIFVTNLDTDRTRAWNVEGIPLRLECRDGSLAYEVESGDVHVLNDLACEATGGD